MAQKKVKPRVVSFILGKGEKCCLVQLSSFPQVGTTFVLQESQISRDPHNMKQNLLGKKIFITEKLKISSEGFPGASRFIRFAYTLKT